MPREQLLQINILTGDLKPNLPHKVFEFILELVLLLDVGREVTFEDFVAEEFVPVEAVFLEGLEAVDEEVFGNGGEGFGEF